VDSIDLGRELLSLRADGQRRSPPLLFVHGGFHGAWCWSDHFMPWFASRGFDCHAISIRDHGASKRTGRDTEWRLRDYVDDVRWAIGQIGEYPILVGHSLGGSIVQKVALDDPCPAMVLLAPSPIGGSNRAALRMLASHPRALMRAMVKKDLAEALPAFLSFFLSSDLSSARRDSIAARLDGLTSFAAAADAFYTDPPRPAATEMPVLVVAGEKDWSIPRYKNARLAKAYGGTLIDVPTAHDIMCDTRWEAAALQIFEWLDFRFGN
jgi:pimeloyl-ACP methyl ester carboxylesterase